MSNLVMKNLPKVKLATVIKRRKTTLKQFLVDAGVQSYRGLQDLCDRFGVSSPSLEEYEAASGAVNVTSQTDGIIVLEPLVNVEPLAETEPLVETKGRNKKRKKES